MKFIYKGEDVSYRITKAYINYDVTDERNQEIKIFFDNKVYIHYKTCWEYEYDTPWDVCNYMEVIDKVNTFEEALNEAFDYLELLYNR